MYLYGASGHAKVVIDILKACNIPVQGLFDDNPDIKELIGHKVYGMLKQDSIPISPFIISIGDNVIRKKISLRYSVRFGKAVHPTAVLSTTSQIAEGSVIMANVTVNAETKVGRHVILNSSCIVEHDCFLDDFVHVSPNACLSGGVRVGEGSHIGSGSVVIPNINIGKWTIIGAGAVIIKDIPDYATVVGNPGRIIKIDNGRALNY